MLRGQGGCPHRAGPRSTVAGAVSASLLQNSPSVVPCPRRPLLSSTAGSDGAGEDGGRRGPGERRRALARDGSAAGRRRVRGRRNSPDSAEKRRPLDETSACVLSGCRSPCRHRHRRRASNLCSSSASSRSPFRQSYHGQRGHVKPLRCPWKKKKKLASSWLREAAPIDPAQCVVNTRTAAPLFFRVPPAP